MTLSTACPKPVKRRTVKRREQKARAPMMAILRESVMTREGFKCRVERLLKKFGFTAMELRPLELAHLKGRGAGGTDTTDNTVMLRDTLHQGARSHHSGHFKVRPLTQDGMNGPCCFEFYEKLPTEIR